MSKKIISENINMLEEGRLISVSFDVTPKKDANVNNLDNNEIPLKGILKTQTNSNDDIEIGLTIIKTCSIIVILTLSIPFIFCDLYFGFTNTTCVLSTPSYLNISMKLYLLVSGFVGLGIVLMLFGAICFMTNDDIKNTYLLCGISFIGILAGMFQFVWNILGGIVFWGYTINEGNCSKTTSTYIFVSLIIKLVANLISINYSIFKKK